MFWIMCMLLTLCVIVLIRYTIIVNSINKEYKRLNFELDKLSTEMQERKEVLWKQLDDITDLLCRSYSLIVKMSKRSRNQLWLNEAKEWEGDVQKYISNLENQQNEQQ